MTPAKSPSKSFPQRRVAHPFDDGSDDDDSDLTGSASWLTATKSSSKAASAAKRSPSGAGGKGIANPFDDGSDNAGGDGKVTPTILI